MNKCKQSLFECTRTLCPGMWSQLGNIWTWSGRYISHEDISARNFTAGCCFAKATGRARINTGKTDQTASRQGILAVTGFQAQREGSSCRGIRVGNGGESNERYQIQTKQPEKARNA